MMIMIVHQEKSIVKSKPLSKLVSSEIQFRLRKYKLNSELKGPNYLISNLRFNSKIYEEFIKQTLRDYIERTKELERKV